MNDMAISNRILRVSLGQELEKRQSRNRNYSLRAFANFLQIDAPTLSKILNGKKLVGKKLIARLSAKLAIPLDRFLSNDSPCKEVNSFQILSEDEAQYLSSWYYYAILELLEVKDFKYDYKWIGQRLNIPKKQVQLAIERMIRLGFLSDESGRLVDKTNGKTTNISSDLSSASRRHHQKGVLELAIDALEQTAPALRDQSSMTVSINSEDVPEAKALIKKFRRDMAKFLNHSNSKDEVYNLSISFFPVTKELQ